MVKRKPCVYSLLTIEKLFEKSLMSLKATNSIASGTARRPRPPRLPTLKGSHTVGFDPFRVETKWSTVTGALPPPIELIPSGDIYRLFKQLLTIY
jgi:hypothetical protein